MTIREKMAQLMREAADLPEEAQAELVHSLIEMRSQHIGTYHLTESDKTALQKSAENVAAGRLVSEAEMEALYSRFGA